jgi:hypothetical protein
LPNGSPAWTRLIKLSGWLEIPSGELLDGMGWQAAPAPAEPPPVSGTPLPVVQ